MDSKYFTIFNEIVSKIENGKLESGVKLPSENELMKIYEVSRDTIRKALNLLERNGYIQKIKGKGSFVLDIHKFDFSVSGLTSFKELAERMDAKSNTILEELSIIEPDDYLRKQLDLSKHEDVWKVIRVREIEDMKIILDKDFLNRKVVPYLTREICENSIYEYLENDLGLKISFAKKEITVQQATEEDRKHLDLEGHTMIVVVKNYTYLEDASLFQYTESRHRPDKFRFVDFARRKH
ncbi:MAG: treR [Anaerosolibacter sp.]|jgi:GntR family trehalose operon transcriptional repressor|uniref:trehalose operon repressor n=1 Tax=Anaerosolibacter sp. TaxID=1872527 RepID=UPI002620FE82|nr:trehalose operon repressor [Anaerosolibacter sp.]MDF2547631.1 treR [Anaerosolibacter sp.]